MQCECGRPSQMDANGVHPLYGGKCFECALQDPETNPYYRPVLSLEERRAKFNATKNKNKEQNNG